MKKQIHCLYENVAKKRKKEYEKKLRVLLNHVVMGFDVFCTIFSMSL